MILVLIGCAMLVLWYADIGPFGRLDWWWPLLPFALAALWWAIQDATGMTQRKAIQRMEDRKVKRRERDMEALGLNTRRARRLDAIKTAHRRAQTPEERESLSPDVNEEGRKRK